MSGQEKEPSKIRQFYVTCAPDETVIHCLMQDVKIWLSQRGCPVNIFICGYTAKDEVAYFVMECEISRFQWEFSNWLALEKRVLSFNYYPIPQVQQPPHTKYVMAALDA